MYAALHSGGDGDSVLLEADVPVLNSLCGGALGVACSPLLLKEMFWRKTCLLKSLSCLEAVSRKDELPVSVLEAVFWLALEMLLPVREAHDAGAVFRATERIGFELVMVLESPPTTLAAVASVKAHITGIINKINLVIWVFKFLIPLITLIQEVSSFKIIQCKVYQSYY